MDRLEFAQYLERLFCLQFSNVEEVIANIDKVEDLHDGLECNVRNFYELVESDELPLLTYWYTQLHGADNFDYTEEEFKDELAKCIENINKFYYA